MNTRRVRTIRVFEETALLIDHILRRSPSNTTYADIVEGWAKELYPKAYGATKDASGQINEALEQDEADHGEAQ